MKVGKYYYVDLEIPDMNLKNFLQPGDVFGLKIVETAGTALPFVVMSFRTFNEDIMNSIKQNNKVKISLGNSEEDADTFLVTIRASEVKSSTMENGWDIEFGGFIGNYEFMVDQKSVSYDGNSLLVAKKIIRDYFGTEIKTDIDRVNENQVKWMRNNKTGYSFLMSVLLHMNLEDSFPIFSFDKYGTFHLKSFKKAVEGGVKYSLVGRPPSKANQYMYMNNFQLESYKSGYNSFIGYNRVVNIQNSNTGEVTSEVASNSPKIASTKVSEVTNAGSNVTTNEIQSDNVHNNYKQAYFNNINGLLLVSSMGGEVLLSGRYFREFAPLDIVNLETQSSNASENGYYIVDTVTTNVNFLKNTIFTSLYLSRDNRNHIENYTKEDEGLKIKSNYLKDLLGAVSSLKSSYASALNVVSGDYLNRYLSFGIEAKNSLLRCFSISGVRSDLTSSTGMLRSLILTGNSLLNSLFKSIFPIEVYRSLQDYILDNRTLKQVVYKLIQEYVPSNLVDIMTDLVDSLFKTANSLNYIADDNGIKVSETSVSISITDSSESVVTETITESQKRVNEIINEFENNTTGLDIPFPVIGLTESQSLLPTKELRNYLAAQTVQNLADLNYIESEEDRDELEDILLGLKPINFSLINRINRNAGNSYNYRFWGTYGANDEALYAWTSNSQLIYTKTDIVKKSTRLYLNDGSPYEGTAFKVEEDSKGEFFISYNGEVASRCEAEDVTSNALAELTSFYIKKSYKDRYRTIPCTKFIDATHNQRIFFACPSSEDNGNLKFYINSKRVILDSFPVDLGYIDSRGTKIIYSVFFTETGYNSNSIMFEVRKG